MSATSSAPSPNFDWVLADCPACGKTMKLRSDRIGKHALVCPSCKAPISIDFATDENKDGKPALRVPSQISPPSTEPPATPSHLPKPTGSRGSLLKGSPIQDLSLPKESVVESSLPPPKRELAEGSSTPASHLPPAKTSFEAKAPPVAPSPTYKKASPAGSKVLPFEDANPNSREEDGTQPPVEKKFTEEFKGKLKAIEAGPQGRQKHRRRLAPGELRVADWDTPNLDKIPEAEVTADEWFEAGPELLPEETMPATSVEVVRKIEIVDGKEVEKIKRVQKRRLLRGVQLFFLRMTAAVRWGILGLLAAVIISGVWFLIHVFGEKAVSMTFEPDAKKLSEAQKSQAELLEELSLADSDGAKKVIKQFLTAPDWQTKAAFVRMPEKVKPLMEKWYVTHPAGPLSGGDIDLIRKVIVGQGYYIFVSTRIGPEHVSRYFAVEQIPPDDLNGPSQYLIDWETSVGYQPVEIYDYRVKQPKEPVTFRVVCKPYEYYNHSYSNSEEWTCYRLTYPGDEEFELIGYVRRKTPLEAEMLQQMLREPNVMLEVQYPEQAISRDQVTITKLIQPSWYVDRPGAKLAGPAKPSGAP